MRSDLNLVIWCDAVHCIQSMFKTVCVDGTECYILIIFPFMHGSQKRENSSTVHNISQEVLIGQVASQTVFCTANFGN